MSKHWAVLSAVFAILVLAAVPTSAAPSHHYTRHAVAHRTNLRHRHLKRHHSWRKRATTRSNMVIDSYTDMHGKTHKGAPPHSGYVKSYTFHFGQ